MRCATVIASSWSWVTITKVVPSRPCRSISSNWVSSRSFLSRAASGSASSSTLRRLARERGRAARGGAVAVAAGELLRGGGPGPLEPHQRQHLGDARLDLAARQPVLLE